MIDFSENYNWKYTKEVQNLLFGANRNQMTMHTAVFYTKDFTQGVVILSESLRYDACSDFAPFNKILSFYSSIFVNTQYLSTLYPQITEISDNYSETGHLKVGADGAGAAAKTALDNAVKYGLDLPDFSAVVSYLKIRKSTMHTDTV